MPVLRQISRAETDSDVVLRYYNRLFGDRDPVAEPGTATGGAPASAPIASHAAT